MKWNSVPTEYSIKFKAYDLYSHSVDDTNRRTESHILASQPDGEFGYFNTNQFALTSSNTFVGNQIISGNLAVTGTITGPIISNVITTGSIYMTGSIETVDHIDFLITANPTHEEGRLHWYDDAKTLAVDTGQENFMIEVGAMTVIRGKNTNNFTLTKGMVVYINGEAGQRPTFTTSSMATEALSARTMGVVASDITSNNSGFVVMNGVLRNINTSMYSANTELYLSSSGQFSNQIPVAPNHNVRVGKVLSSAVNGSIYVYIMNGFELNELHDVLINGSLKDAATNNGGSTLYRSASVWTNNDNVRLAQSTMVLASVSSSYNFADDTAAQAGGIPLGGLYHTSGTIKIRLV
jgi:hypothetical protein